MFKIGDIVRVVNNNGEYSITLDGTIGRILTPPNYLNKCLVEIFSLPDCVEQRYIGDTFPLSIKYLELVTPRAAPLPYEEVITKIKVMEARFTTRKEKLKKQPYVYLDIPF